MTRLEALFREIREAWFVHHVEHHPHERESESERDAKDREDWNRNLKELFDMQTEQIIRGANLPLTPRCMNDMLEFMNITGMSDKFRETI